MTMINALCEPWWANLQGGGVGEANCIYCWGLGAFIYGRCPCYAFHHGSPKPRDLCHTLCFLMHHWSLSCWIIADPQMSKGTWHIQDTRLKEGKTGLVRGRVPVGSGRVNGEGEGGWIWSMYFVYEYENRMKPIEIVLRRKERDEGEWLRGESN
jgi:hypothetical protein